MGRKVTDLVACVFISEKETFLTQTIGTIHLYGEPNRASQFSQKKKNKPRRISTLCQVDSFPPTANSK